MSEEQIQEQQVNIEQAPERQQTFIETLPEELRQEKSLVDFKDVQSLAKSYVNAQRMIGNSIRIPSEDASKEAFQDFHEKLSKVNGVVKLPDMENEQEVSAFFEKLGRPSAADQYESLAEAKQIFREDLIDKFADVAFAHGLNNKQVKALIEYQKSITPTQEQVEAEEMQSVEKTRDSLKKLWGSEYDRKVQSANEVLSKYSEKYGESVQELAYYAKHNPALVAMMSDLADSFNESTTQRSEGGLKFGITPEQAKEKLDELKGDRGHLEALFNQMHPGHKDALAKRQRLYQIVSGG